MPPNKKEPLWPQSRRRGDVSRAARSETCIARYVEEKGKERKGEGKKKKGSKKGKGKGMKRKCKIKMLTSNRGKNKKDLILSFLSFSVIIYKKI